MCKLNRVNTDQKDVKCPPDSFNADFCAAYKIQIFIWSYGPTRI